MKTKFTLLLFLLLSFQIVKSQYTADFSSTLVCLGMNTSFTSYSSPTNAISWYWNFGDGDTSNVQNPTHLYGSSGNYTVKLISSDGINTDSISKSVTVNSTPIVDFTYTMSGDTVQFFDQSSNDAIQWYWNFGNGTTSNYANPVTTYPYPPDSCYDVTLSVINNFVCMASLTKNDYICMGSATIINEVEKNSISIYPSPIINNQKLTVKGMGVEKMVAFDVLGSLIQLPIISKNENEIIFETNQLNKGVYFLQLLFNDGSSATKKIIVQ